LSHLRRVLLMNIPGTVMPPPRPSIRKRPSSSDQAGTRGLGPDKHSMVAYRHLALWHATRRTGRVYPGCFRIIGGGTPRLISGRGFGRRPRRFTGLGLQATIVRAREVVNMLVKWGPSESRPAGSQHGDGRRRRGTNGRGDHQGRPCGRLRRADAGGGPYNSTRPGGCGRQFRQQRTAGQARRGTCGERQRRTPPGARCPWDSRAGRPCHGASATAGTACCASAGTAMAVCESGEFGRFVELQMAGKCKLHKFLLPRELTL
jgi:hypothetical protein